MTWDGGLRSPGASGSLREKSGGRKSPVFTQAHYMSKQTNDGDEDNYEI